MPSTASSPRVQLDIASVVLVLAGTVMCAAAAVDAMEHGRPVGGLHLLIGGVSLAFGLAMLGTLRVGHALDRRVRRGLTLQAGAARELVSLSQAAHFLHLTRRSVPEDAARVLAAHDVPELAAAKGSRVPRYGRDPNLLVDWVDSGESVDLYVLALTAAIQDADLRAHLSGADPLDPVLLEQRAANIRAASWPTLQPASRR